jgi:Holliday junction resolvase
MVYTCGYSGSNAFPQPDILLTTTGANYAIELKKRAVDTGERVYEDKADLEQLLACANDVTAAVLWYKFTNRRPALIQVWQNGGGTVSMDPPDAFEGHLTEKSIRFTKPDLDSYPSAHGTKDHFAALEELGLEHDENYDPSDRETWLKGDAI